MNTHLNYFPPTFDTLFDEVQKLFAEVQSLRSHSEQLHADLDDVSKAWAARGREHDFLRYKYCAMERERDEALALVASYDRQDELIGTEFEGVDEVTEVIRLLKQERDAALASCAALAKAKGLA
jgi:hypothetical protein